MPPSTVFPYWRRDHRRSTAPLASLPASSAAPKGAIGSPSTPPQLPEIPDTPNLSQTLDGRPSHDASSWTDSLLENETTKLKFNTSAAPLSSSLSLAVPSPSVEKENRPYSSPHEHESESQFTSQSNNSHLSVGGVRSDQGDLESNSKPSSPFRLSFGKGPRNLQTSTSEAQKRSPTPGSGTSHFRLKTSPEGSPADKPNMVQKEVKGDGAMSRRVGEREVATEQAHHKSGKTMLHLLNPMSLLARRRSSHLGGSRVDDAKIGAPNLIPAIPDDYDPRIRGNIIHDFSAPRPRRTVSGAPSVPPGGNNQLAQDSPSLQSSEKSPGSPWKDQTKRYSDHSPVFKEHFEDDRNVLQPENKGYLQSSLLTSATQPGYEKSIPVFARRLPSHLPEQEHNSVDQSVSPPAELPAQLPADLPAEVPKDQPGRDPHGPQPDPDIIPKAPQQQLSGLPKHLKSNASRFSFDMGGMESSAQEKLLEEKHKAKEAARKLEDGYFDDFDDEFDHDLLDDVDGLEEKIPGVNVDADDDEYDVASLGVKSWAAPGLSPVIASPITPALPENPTPATDDEYVAPSDQNRLEQTDLSPDLAATSRSTSIEGERSPQTDQSSVMGNDLSADTRQVSDAKPPAPGPVEDDLYFDDGEFGDLSVEEQEGAFDESIFDDETSHLYKRNPVGEPVPQPTQKEDLDNDALQKELAQEEAASHGLKHMPSVASDHRIGSIKRGPLGEPIPNMGPARAHGGVLTEQNLEVLHNALAFAASEAASKGQVERNFSTSNRSLGQESVSQTSHTGDSQPGMVSDDSRLSQAADALGFEDTYDDQIYDDDDAFYDDPIVAAANAEALENDDEGFYGQEFGFYAHAHGTCSSELTNGGYFGPRGVEGITRSHSSRGKFREPSLTPITERSEWSTRNSVISLKAHGATHSNPSLGSPGLAQLVDMGNLDDEMSLSALMKLRRGAWGGSNGSLRSSAGSPPPHTLSSSHRGSFTGASEASPSETRPSGEDGFYQPHDDTQPYTVSPLKETADLPANGMGGPMYVNGVGEPPTSGAQRPNNLF